MRVDAFEEPFPALIARTYIASNEAVQRYIIDRCDITGILCTINSLTIVCRRLCKNEETENHCQMINLIAVENNLNLLKIILSFVPRRTGELLKDRKIHL